MSFINAIRKLCEKYKFGELSYYTKKEDSDGKFIEYKQNTAYKCIYAANELAKAHEIDDGKRARKMLYYLASHLPNERTQNKCREILKIKNPIYNAINSQYNSSEDKQAFKANVKECNALLKDIWFTSISDLALQDKIETTTNQNEPGSKTKKVVKFDLTKKKSFIKNDTELVISLDMALTLKQTNKSFEIVENRWVYVSDNLNRITAHWEKNPQVDKDPERFEKIRDYYAYESITLNKFDGFYKKNPHLITDVILYNDCEFDVPFQIAADAFEVFPNINKIQLISFRKLILDKLTLPENTKIDLKNCIIKKYNKKGLNGTIITGAKGCDFETAASVDGIKPKEGNTFTSQSSVASLNVKIVGVPTKTLQIPEYCVLDRKQIQMKNNMAIPYYGYGNDRYTGSYNTFDDSFSYYGNERKYTIFPIINNLLPNRFYEHCFVWRRKKESVSHTLQLYLNFTITETVNNQLLLSQPIKDRTPASHFITIEIPKVSDDQGGWNKSGFESRRGIVLLDIMTFFSECIKGGIVVPNLTLEDFYTDVENRLLFRSPEKMYLMDKLKEITLATTGATPVHELQLRQEFGSSDTNNIYGKPIVLLLQFLYATLAACKDKTMLLMAQFKTNQIDYDRIGNKWWHDHIKDILSKNPEKKEIESGKYFFGKDDYILKHAKMGSGKTQIHSSFRGIVQPFGEVLNEWKEDYDKHKEIMFSTYKLLSTDQKQDYNRMYFDLKEMLIKLIGSQKIKDEIDIASTNN